MAEYAFRIYASSSRPRGRIETEIVAAFVKYGSEYGKIIKILTGDDKKQKRGSVLVYFESPIDNISQIRTVLIETMKLKDAYGLIKEK